MKNLNWALAEVERAPQGPSVGAFFDLDGTLVEGFTAKAMVQERLLAGHLSPRDALTVLGLGVGHRYGRTSGEDLIAAGVGLLAGEPVEELQAQANQLFRKRIAPTIRPEARTLIRAHRKAGHMVVMATAATPPQAEPVARDLGIAHLLSTEIEIEDGAVTGRLASPPRWGREKAEAVRTFARAEGIELGASFAYGNGDEDCDFLDAVGRPVAVTPEANLAKYADRSGIPILDLDPPAAASARSVVGTLSAVGAMNATLIAGWAISRPALGIPFPTRLGWGADLTLRAAGVSVSAEGRQYIDEARPAIIVFNHQSNLDPLVVGSLVRRDFTAVGKKELANDPRGLALRLLDVALIDRSDPETARRDVAALVERVKGGESVLIAPEGTRMPTPSLGPFKLGAFNLAVDAGVPILPIVIHNTYALWPRTALSIRPGTVEVEVLEPISTEGWRKADVPSHAAATRVRFAEVLERGPVGRST